MLDRKKYSSIFLIQIDENVEEEDIFKLLSSRVHFITYHRNSISVTYILFTSF